VDPGFRQESGKNLPVARVSSIFFRRACAEGVDDGGSTL
jgi:hypothetical protein